MKSHADNKPLVPLPLSENEAARYWSQVDKNGPLPDQSNPHYKGLGPCWTWTGALSRGYGKLRRDGRSAGKVGAHRVAWMIAGRSFPDGHHILHQCDNPSCVNPQHLWSGTAIDNKNDREVKARTVVLIGERNGCAKLTEVDVKKIREIYSHGGVGQIALGKKYGVRHSLIGAIVRREIWKHVP